MTPSLFQLLKGVSRSFFLSMRILPRAVRNTIAVTYLLARAADTIADTEVIAGDERKICLQALRSAVQSDTPQSKTRFFSYLQRLQPHAPPAEQELLKRLEEVLEIFLAMPKTHLPHARKVIATLTQGMHEDLERFGTGSGGGIHCLENSAALARYTYQVAGCVGEFWTDLLLEEKICAWPREEAVSIAVRFGQGLQLVNILRDMPKDLQAGRCYLAQDDLESHGINNLQLARLQTKSDAELVKKLTGIYTEHCALARSWLSAGMLYVRLTPRHLVNLRLAALWPLLIGLATLRALEQNPEKLWQSKKPVKVGRRRVYAMMMLTALFSPLNAALYGYYRRQGGLAV